MLYGTTGSILVFGDGDLSFSKSLSDSLRDPSRITATTYLSLEELRDVYGAASINKRIRSLRKKKVTIHHNIDATSYESEKKYAYVVWNFPCVAPTSNRRADGQNDQIPRNQQLLRAFFSHVPTLLRDDNGEVHLTHKSKPPFCHWDVAAQARASANNTLSFEGCLIFDRTGYPGYRNRKARCGSGSFPIHDARIFVFRKLAIDCALDAKDRPTTLRRSDRRFRVVDDKVLKRSLAVLREVAAGMKEAGSLGRKYSSK